MATKIAPPKLKNDTSYSKWKNKLDMWRIVFGYEKKETSYYSFITIFQWK